MNLSAAFEDSGYNFGLKILSYEHLLYESFVSWPVGPKLQIFLSNSQGQNNVCANEISLLDYGLQEVPGQVSRPLFA